MPEATAAAPPGGIHRHSSLTRWLLHAAYDLLFIVFLVVASPYFVLRAIQRRDVRGSLISRFGAIPARPDSGSAVWVHGVSVGEVKAAQPLIQAFTRESEVGVVVSSTTPAGLRVAQSLFAGHHVVQFPLDLSWIVRRVLRRLRPTAIVLMELEVWPNLLDQAARLGIPVLVMNGRISERSFAGYRRFRWLLPEFGLIACYAVQNPLYAERLRQLGVAAERIHVTGNLKYDSLAPDADAAAVARLRGELGLTPGQPVLVGGSTHPGEEEALLEAFAQLRRGIPGLRLVLAPRHVERAGEVVRLVERRGYPVAILTALRQAGSPAPGDAVLLVNTIGELENIYGLADVVFVGGSLVKRGGHNVLEPAALGKPVLFGPHMANFREEESLLLEHEAAKQVDAAASLAREVEGLLGQPEQGAAMGRRARAAVATMRGATRRNLKLILDQLDT